MLKDKDLVDLKKQDLSIYMGNVKVSNLKKYISKSVMDECISKVDKPKDKALIIFLWMTGTRVSECINIRREHLLFEDGFIRIKWLKSRKFFERLIPMHHKLKQFLWLYTTALKYDSLVFPISRQRVEQITKKWLGCSPHKIRHSFAVNFVQQSKHPGSMRILQKILGHNNINTTMKYLDYVPVDQAEELNKVDY